MTHKQISSQQGVQYKTHPKGKIYYTYCTAAGCNTQCKAETVNILAAGILYYIETTAKNILVASVWSIHKTNQQIYSQWDIQNTLHTIVNILATEHYKYYTSFQAPVSRTDLAIGLHLNVASLPSLSEHVIRIPEVY
jgi:hypothetical protein